MSTRSLALLAVLMLAASGRGQRDYPLSEVWSGKALNDLLERLEGRSAPPGAEPEAQLDRKTLDALNVGSAAGKGGVLSLRKADKAEWPAALLEGKPEKARERWVGLAKRATREAEKGSVSVAAQKDMAALHKQLLEELDGKVDDIGISDYIVAKRFLVRIKDDVALAKTADLGEVMKAADDLVARRRTVPELVNRMREKKLCFAACLPGHEKIYEALYKAMTDLDRRAAK
jgi:hypothetical protein